MSQVIKRMHVAYRSSTREYVPEDATIVRIEVSDTQFQHVDIFYQCSYVEPEEEDARPTKKWEIMVIDDTDQFSDQFQYLSSVMEKGYTYHVLRVNPFPGQLPTV